VEPYKLNRSSSLLVQCQSILSVLLVLATILGTSATRSFGKGTALSDYDDPLDFGLTVDDIPCLGCDCCCCKTAGICCQLCPHCNPCGDGNNEDCPGPDFGCDSIPDDQDHCCIYPRLFMSLTYPNKQKNMIMLGSIQQIGPEKQIPYVGWRKGGQIVVSNTQERRQYRRQV
jgi:hypothetical protein